MAKWRPGYPESHHGLVWRLFVFDPGWRGDQILLCLMETTSYPVKKVDTRLYIKGLSGPLVFRALYGIIAAFFGFSGVYILLGAFPAVLMIVPAFFVYLYRLNRIQKTYGPEGWGKKQTSRKLPQFISCKRRTYHTLTRNP